MGAAQQVPLATQAAQRLRDGSPRRQRSARMWHLLRGSTERSFLVARSGTEPHRCLHPDGHCVHVDLAVGLQHQILRSHLPQRLVAQILPDEWRVLVDGRACV